MNTQRTVNQRLTDDEKYGKYWQYLTSPVTTRAAVMQNVYDLSAVSSCITAVF